MDSKLEHWFPLPLEVRMKNSGRTAVLTAPFVFVDWQDAKDPKIVVRVPEGFETDFNSVPRGLWNIFPPWEYPEAAVVHDYLYRHPAIELRREADAVHRRILELLGCTWVKRWAAWGALRSFGWTSWRRIPEGGSVDAKL